MRYTAKTLLWHSREGRYVQPGEEVNLAHLDPDQIEALIRAGYVEARREPRKSVSEEGEDGSND